MSEHDAERTSEKLIDFEMRLMHQEKLLEQLNDVAVEQQGTIQRLQKEIARLKEQLVAGPNEDVNEPPPHY